MTTPTRNSKAQNLIKQYEHKRTDLESKITEARLIKSSARQNKSYMSFDEASEHLDGLLNLDQAYLQFIKDLEDLL
jgi:hypothetical protein